GENAVAPLGMELVDRVFEEPLVIHVEVSCSKKRRRRLRLEATYGPGTGTALSYVKLQDACRVSRRTGFRRKPSKTDSNQSAG
ncbi:hypothetical protein, partial [Mesorhizobium sp.]|uniref:hypothetical protein n=1 Tax=Mesorhizobium sp. TaxID=1871066 RepID=UPI0025C22149